MPPTPVAAPSKRASVAWRFFAICASSAGWTARRAALVGGPALGLRAERLRRGERDVLRRPDGVEPQAVPQAGRQPGRAVAWSSASAADTPVNLPGGPGRSLGRMDRKWWTLLAVNIGTFMLLLDVTIVNTALPYIERALGASFADLQWVIDAYALTLAALLLTGGSLADLFGRRLVFVVGLAVFTVASLLCGLAGSPLFLNLARALQGCGGGAHVRDGARAARERVRGTRPRDRVRPVGRDHRRGRGGRAARRRRAHRGARLGVHLLRQRPDRHRRDRDDAGQGRGVAQPGGGQRRLGRPGHVLGRPRVPRLRADPRERRGLELAG